MSEECVSKVNHMSNGSHICQVNETMPQGIMMSLHAAAGSLTPILHSSGLSQQWIILCLDLITNVLFNNVIFWFFFFPFLIIKKQISHSASWQKLLDFTLIDKMLIELLRSITTASTGSTGHLQTSRFIMQWLRRKMDNRRAPQKWSQEIYIILWWLAGL